LECIHIRQTQTTDNICLRRILRIPYTAHVTSADVRLRAGSPPQLLPIIQTRWLHFFWHVAWMGDSQDTFRALHTSTRGLETPPRTSTSHLATDPGSRPSSAQPRTELSMVTCPLPRIEDDGGSLWKRLHSSQGTGSPTMMMMMMCCVRMLCCER